MKFESIAGCTPAAAVMTAAVVVILAGCSARPVQTSSTAPVRPDSVLLTAEEANTTLGSSDMQLIGPINHETFTKNLPTSVSHPDCLSTANVALDRRIRVAATRRSFKSGWLTLARIFNQRTFSSRRWPAFHPLIWPWHSSTTWPANGKPAPAKPSPFKQSPQAVESIRSSGTPRVTSSARSQDRAVENPWYARLPEGT
jgi:hypothetical protein